MGLRVYALDCESRGGFLLGRPIYIEKNLGLTEARRLPCISADARLMLLVSLSNTQWRFHGPKAYGSCCALISLFILHAGCHSYGGNGTGRTGAQVFHVIAKEVVVRLWKTQQDVAAAPWPRAQAALS